jgi:hypothetical protein
MIPQADVGQHDHPVLELADQYQHADAVGSLEHPAFQKHRLRVLADLRFGAQPVEEQPGERRHVHRKQSASGTRAEDCDHVQKQLARPGPARAGQAHQHNEQRPG